MSVDVMSNPSTQMAQVTSGPSRPRTRKSSSRQRLILPPATMQSSDARRAALTYLGDSKVADVYEALICALAVIQPQRPKMFILEKLYFLKRTGLHNVRWNMFIDSAYRSRAKIARRSSWEMMLAIGLGGGERLEAQEPSSAMLERAYGYYNRHLINTGFSHWVQYYVWKEHQREGHLWQTHTVRTQHERHIVRRMFESWRSWTRFIGGREQVALGLLEHVYRESLARLVFRAWRASAVDARRTREYFERLERGENLEQLAEDMGRGDLEHRDRVGSLPDNVKIKIFSHLNIAELARCAQVCRAWKMVAESGGLWFKADFHGVRHILPEKLCERMLHRYRPFLVHVSLRACTQLREGGGAFQALAECKNLQDLNLSDCAQLSDQVVRAVVQQCPMLLYLNLSRTPIGDTGIWSIANYCDNLVSLSLAYCTRFTDRALEYFPATRSGLPMRLEQLDLSGCEQLTARGHTHLAAVCTRLKVLVLDNNATLSDDSLQTFSEHCAELQSVSIKRTPGISERGLASLSALPHLRRLKCDGSSAVGEASLKAVLAHAEHLHHLQLADCVRAGDALVRHVGQNCHHLSVLNLADCSRVSDAGVRAVTDSSVAACLRELNLANCARVGDIALVAIIKRCTSLAYLNVAYCERITETGIELLGAQHSLLSIDISGTACGDMGLASVGRARRLRELVVSECLAITDVGVQKLAQQCKQIEALDISLCRQITDAGVKALAFSTRLLVKLNVSGCKQVTDLSIQYLTGVCRYLRYLDVSGCILLSERTMKFLKKNCKLRVLRALYCKNIPRAAVVKYGGALERLEYSASEPPEYFGYDSSGLSLEAVAAAYAANNKRTLPATTSALHAAPIVPTAAAGSSAGNPTAPAADAASTSTSTGAVVAPDAPDASAIVSNPPEAPVTTAAPTATATATGDAQPAEAAASASAGGEAAAEHLEPILATQLPPSEPQEGPALHADASNVK